MNFLEILRRDLMEHSVSILVFTVSSGRNFWSSENHLIVICDLLDHDANARGLRAHIRGQRRGRVELLLLQTTMPFPKDLGPLNKEGYLSIEFQLHLRREEDGGSIVEKRCSVREDVCIRLQNVLVYGDACRLALLLGETETR